MPSEEPDPKLQPVLSLRKITPVKIKKFVEAPKVGKLLADVFLYSDKN